jgi:HEAT repeat protein/tRNA A-37 threonylcarbamoyl transferase component Bud32
MRVCTSCRRLLKADTQRCPTDGAAAEVVATLPNHTRLGAYRIDRMLGEGGMGFVYEATHEVLNRRSAIKMLRPELASHEQIVIRFLNEAKAVNLIDHQNIVNVYDYGDSQDGSVYFVMEFLEGETLDDLMRKRQPMAVPLVLHVFGQIAKALAAAHAKQIVHRDLKPANVFIIAREHNPYFVKLLDFGIAQLRGAGAVHGLTLAGSVLGTPQYMSPEQISGGTVDARTDVWAMGVMMYRAATGQAPFKGEEFGELADKILHHPPTPAGELVALPKSLSALIASCLERRIEARCPSIGDVLAGLERVKHEAKLDDDAILAAVTVDAGRLAPHLPTRAVAPTRESLAGSLPRYQGGRELRLDPVAARPRSRLGWYIAIAALAGVVAAVGVRARGWANVDPPATGSEAVVPPSGPAQISIKERFAAGDAAGGRALAERNLRTAITSGTLQQRGFAAEALGRSHVAAGAPLLYAALSGPIEVQVKAAHALGELRLPDAAPKLRAALATSGERAKLELAAVLFRLGDKEARAMLVRATSDLGQRLIAASALAESSDDAGRAALRDVLQTTKVGSDQWRRAAGGLVKLGDVSARALLESELAQSDAERAVGAAAVLAAAGNAKARDQLARVVADKSFARPGDAAVALARLGDKRALGWVMDGFASEDAKERNLALAICGLLPADTTAHTGTVAKLATDDLDLTVRMTAEAVLLGL